MQNKKYRITKYLTQDGTEKFSVAIWGRSFYLGKGYFFSDENLKELESLEEAKRRIKLREECLNFEMYI